MEVIDRLEQITRCMDEIEIIYQEQKTAKQSDKDLWLLGELDWLEELHRLLYE